MKKENDILETTLALAEDGYTGAYRYLLQEYEKETKAFGPQTLYFLACLAGGDSRPEQALEWLRKAVAGNSWWYRPEVLEDDDLAPLKNDAEFISLKALSDARYARAVSGSKALFSWTRRTADGLFLAVHGNTQNGQTAWEDWAPVLEGGSWQLETVQSAEPDGYGTYRWSYDMRSCLPVARAMEQVRDQGYGQIVCGGFSAGCDMLLRAVLFSSARCDMLVLQSPWLPVLEGHEQELVRALSEKNIALRTLCGAEDEDCLPMARQLSAAAERAGLDTRLVIQPGSRHQFPARPYTLKSLYERERPE